LSLEFLGPAVSQFPVLGFKRAPTLPKVLAAFLDEGIITARCFEPIPVRCDVAENRSFSRFWRGMFGSFCAGTQDKSAGLSAWVAMRRSSSKEIARLYFCCWQIARLAQW
jgi:hypothetical protein